MNLHIDAVEFSDVIQAAVDAAVEATAAKLCGSADGDDPVLWGKRRAAAGMDVSESTLNRWRREEGLPFVKLNGLVLFRPESLREWASAREAERCRC